MPADPGCARAFVEGFGARALRRPLTDGEVEHDLAQFDSAAADGDFYEGMRMSIEAMLITEINDGNLHDHSDMPFVLAGGASGQLETGRSLDYRGSAGGENEAHTKLLVSLSKMMGVDIETFGYDGSGPGGLDGL